MHDMLLSLAEILYMAHGSIDISPGVDELFGIFMLACNHVLFV